MNPEKFGAFLMGLVLLSIALMFLLLILFSLSVVFDPNAPLPLRFLFFSTIPFSLAFNLGACWGIWRLVDRFCEGE